jgi:hypothetical protein
MLRDEYEKEIKEKEERKIREKERDKMYLKFES